MGCLTWQHDWGPLVLCRGERRLCESVAAASRNAVNLVGLGHTRRAFTKVRKGLCSILADEGAVALRQTRDNGDYLAQIISGPRTGIMSPHARRLESGDYLARFVGGTTYVVIMADCRANKAGGGRRPWRDQLMSG